jgi:8-oxo-dGTP pyrophosphatase MutT (NUDIX family)
MADPEILSRERVFEGKVFAIERDRVRLASGREVTLDLVRHAPSVVLLPFPETGRIILVRQYRHAVNRWLWELPAGTVDDGESSEEAARRECHEEIGLVPDTQVRLGALLPTPGYCDEEMVFYRLSGLRTPDHAAEPDDDEEIEVGTFDLREARDMVRRGEIIDMKTIVGLGMV